MTDEASTSNFESRDAALKDGGATPQSNLVKMWLTAIAAASKDEDAWRKEGDEILQIYRSEEEERSQTAFNILYSNTETLLPALYNSTPVPDIRRRYNDPGVVSKAVADILERSISYSIDMYDFDASLRAAMFDAAVPGRGVVRVRYSPHIEGSEDHGAEAEGPESSVAEDLEHSPEGEGEAPEAGERVTSHEVRAEYVAWKNFRRGPGLVWDDVDWIAFEHFLSREQLQQLDDTVGKKVKFDCTTTGESDKQDHEKSMAEGDIFARARVWEIWDRIEQKVLFIAPSFIEKPIKVADDPLKLTGFFPIPRPLMFVDTPTDLVPVPPYRCYKHLAEELNEVTARIRKLVRQIRVKGLYAAPADNLQEIVDADDGDLIPVPGLEMFIANGGMDKAISWWPIEPATKALAQLYEQREAIKSTIYEVCGIADIMRGNTKSSETLGAQQIKAQWGSLRVQRAQAEIARFVRDVFRIKAELISTYYDMPTLVQMTGVELYSQADKQLAMQKVQLLQQQAQQMQAQSVAPAAPAAGEGAAPPSSPAQPQIPEELKKVLDGPSIEEVEQLLRSDIMRSYRVDVESDSTIRADLTRNQESMNNFIQGTAAYIQAVGPAIMSGIIPKDLVVEIFSSFARNFRLGKQVEDALDKASSAAKDEAQNPPPAKPDPEMAKIQAQAQAKQQELQMKQQELAMTLQFKQQEAQLDAQVKQQAADADIQIAYAKANAEMQIKSMQAQKQAEAMDNKNQIQLAQANQGMTQDAEMHDATLQQVRQGNAMAVQRHGLEMESAQAEGQRASERHKIGLEVTKAKAKQQPGK